MTTATITATTAPDYTTLHRICGFDDDALIAEVTESLAGSERLRARFLVALGEFEARGLARTRGAHDCAAWLVNLGGQSTRAAQDYRLQARHLQNWPEVAAHYLAGNLSYSKIRLLFRYLTDDNAEELLPQALAMTCEDLRTALSGRPRDTDGEDQEERFSFRIDPDTGWASFHGRLNPEHASATLAALKMAELGYLRDLADLDLPADISPAELDEHIDDTRVHTEDASPALSSEREPRPGHLRGLTEDDLFPTAPGVTRYGRPQRSTMLASLLGMVNSVLSAPRSHTRAPGAEVHLLLGEDGNVRIPGHLGEETSRLLDAVINGAVTVHERDRDGTTLAVGNRTRVIPKKLETALLAAWNFQCAVPGCTHSRYLEFHHLLDFALGGPTDPNNLITLCSGCHALVTDGAVTIHADSADPCLLHFRFPGGVSHTSRRRRLPRRNPTLSAHCGETYLDGPVPIGDECFSPVWKIDGVSFDD